MGPSCIEVYLFKAQQRLCVHTETLVSLSTIYQHVIIIVLALIDRLFLTMTTCSSRAVSTLHQLQTADYGGSHVFCTRAAWLPAAMKACMFSNAPVVGAEAGHWVVAEILATLLTGLRRASQGTILACCLLWLPVLANLCRLPIFVIGTLSIIMNGKGRLSSCFQYSLPWAAWQLCATSCWRAVRCCLRN